MSNQPLKKRLDEYLSAHAKKWINYGHDIQSMPEGGFCEFQTSEYIFGNLSKLRLDSLEKLPITGCIGRIKGQQPGPSVAVLAELDAVLCPGHPLGNPQTGLAHSCGHDAQMTMLLAVAEAIASLDAMQELYGEVVFIALPAEEGVDKERYLELKEKGLLEYDSGKQELLRLHYFDRINATISVHAYTEGKLIPPAIYLQHSCNGFGAMKIHFIGKAAHASEPDTGINALNAAVYTINGLMGLRETFREEDFARIAYIIKDGGVNLSTIPEKAELWVQARAKRIEKLQELLKACETIASNAANMVGATVRIEHDSMCLPFIAAESMTDLVRENAEKLGFIVYDTPHGTYCTDLGDVSQVVPSVHFSFSGYTGNLHSKDFFVVDEQMVYLNPARVVAATLVDMLQS